MLSKEELIQTTEYWVEEIQNNIYSEVINFMKEKNLNQNQLSDYLSFSKGYISQILKGECNFSIKKLVELSLKIKTVPKLEFAPLNNEILKELIMKYEPLEVIDFKGGTNLGLVNNTYEGIFEFNYDINSKNPLGKIAA